jgi:hypothetical protein
MFKTKMKNICTNNQLIPQSPALRGGIARCLAKSRHGYAYLLLAREGEKGFAPSIRKRGGSGVSYGIMAFKKGFRLGHWNLELGIYLEFGICDLEF